MTRRDYGHKYPTNEFNEPEKYLPSFFVEISFDNQILKAEIRPLRKDVGYYTVNLNNVFLAHIHKVGSVWSDFLGGSNELYQVIGSEIEGYLNKKDDL